MKFRFGIIILVISLITIMTSVYAEENETTEMFNPRHTEEIILDWNVEDLDGEFFVVMDDTDGQPKHNSFDNALLFDEDELDGEYYTVYPSYAPLVNEVVKVQLNGEEVDFTDANGNKVEPQIVNSRTMVPMRKIFEVFGATVEWEETTQTVTAQKDTVKIILQINNPEAKLINENGETKTITLDSAPIIIDDRTMVPVRFIAESLNKKVGWDSDYRTVIIIDTSFVEETISRDASNLYEFLNREIRNCDTYNIDVNSKFDMAITSEDEKEKESASFTGNMKSDNQLIKFTGTIKIKGQGTQIEEILKEIPAEINFDFIFDIENATFYIKSAQIERANGKWIKCALDSEFADDFHQIIEELGANTKYSITDMVDMLLSEQTMTVNTYSILNGITNFITTIFGNDNLKVTNKGGQTIYELNLDASTILNVIAADLEDEEMKSIIDGIKFEVTMTTVIKDDIATSSQIGLNVGGSYEGMSLSVSADSKATLKEYNKTVNIKLPDESDIIEVSLDDFEI